MTDCNSKVGTKWHWEHWRGSDIIDLWDEKNLVPNEGLDRLKDIAFSGATQGTSFYVGIYKNSGYTPAATETYMAHNYTESTDYSESTRPVWNGSEISLVQISNIASKASFTMQGTDTSIYGGVLVTGNVKGDSASTSAKLCAISPFSTAKTSIENGDVLKVTIAINLTSS